MKSFFIIAILWLFSANPLACEEPFKLHIGIVPWAPAQMNQIWASRLKPHLQNYCIDATFSSAHSFKEFIKKTLNQEFDVVDVPPNIGSFLNLKKNMPIVALEAWQAELLYVVHHESAIRSVLLMLQIGGNILLAFVQKKPRWCQKMRWYISSLVCGWTDGEWS